MSNKFHPTSIILNLDFNNPTDLEFTLQDNEEARHKLRPDLMIISDINKNNKMRSHNI